MSYKQNILDSLAEIAKASENPIAFALSKGRVYDGISAHMKQFAAETFSKSWINQECKDAALWVERMETENAELANLAFGAGSK